MAPSTKEDWSALAYEATGLFSPCAPIDEAALFAGRQTQPRKLIETALEKGKHAVLYGERGVGKTSLVKVFRLLFPSITSKVSLIREQCDVADTFSSVWRKVFKDIRVTVTIDGQERVITIADLYEGQITSDDVRRELAKAFAPNEIPIVVIDEFDRTSADLRQEMASAIKDLSDDGVNVTVIMVGVADDIEDLFRGHQSIPRCIEQIPMPRMSNGEMKEIIDKRLPRLGMKIVGDAMWKIITLSRGLPSYVHLLGVNAVQSALGNRRLQIAETDADTAIKRAIDKSQESVRSSYATAIHTNRTDTHFKEVLLACALAKSDERGFFTPNAVVAPLTKIVNRTMGIANFQNHLKKFIGAERGQILVRRGKERAYKFRFQDPMMQPFVIMKGVEEGLIRATALDVLSSPEQPELPIEPKRPF
jgi:Cdc6-like AAA superfamily ATPase